MIPGQVSYEEYLEMTSDDRMGKYVREPVFTFLEFWYDYFDPEGLFFNIREKRDILREILKWNIIF